MTMNHRCVIFQWVYFVAADGSEAVFIFTFNKYYKEVEQTVSDTHVQWSKPFLIYLPLSPIPIEPLPSCVLYADIHRIHGDIPV